MNTAPEATARAAAERGPLTSQEAQEQMAARLGPPPSLGPPADTQAAQAAQAAAERALRALESAMAALERSYAQATQTADVAAMTALAAQRPLRQTELLTLAVSAAKAVEHACGLQLRDAQAAGGPVREWSQRADEIATQARESAELAEQQALRARGLAQQTGLRVVHLSEQSGKARQAVRAATARLSEHLAAFSAPPPAAPGRSRGL